MTLAFLRDPKLESTPFVSLDNAAYEWKDRKLTKQTSGGCFFALAKNQIRFEDPT